MVYKIEVEGRKVFLLDLHNKKKFVGEIGGDTPEEIEYFFTNNERNPYNCDYDDIKNLMINKIPNNVHFYISETDYDNNIIEEVKEVPYPFNCIDLIKKNHTASIILSSCTEVEEWQMRWSRGPFFDQLIYNGSRFENLNIVIDESRNYDNGKVLLELKIEEDINISDAIKDIKRIAKEIISDTEISLTGLSRFQEVLNIWKENRENIYEEFWQTILMKYSWVIGQCVSLPLIIFHDKAYIGGKDISNKNGGAIDFVYKNKFTSNIVLIEIKTPQTPLIGREYRKAHSLSSELSGAVNQVLLYKESCQKDFVSLIRHSKEVYEPFNPKCLLIIGEMDFLDEREKVTFELFRNELKSVEIITFDELFEKIKILLDLSRNNNL